MKCNQSCLRFELVSPCPFLTTITITPQALLILILVIRVKSFRYLLKVVKLVSCSYGWLIKYISIGKRGPDFHIYFLFLRKPKRIFTKMILWSIDTLLVDDYASHLMAMFIHICLQIYNLAVILWWCKYIVFFSFSGILCQGIQSCSREKIMLAINDYCLEG